MTNIDQPCIMSLNDLMRLELPLRIPFYQRGFEWTNEQIDALKDRLENKARPLFLGSIVLARHEDHLNVVDGQQRLKALSRFYGKGSRWDFGQRTNGTQAKKLLDPTQILFHVRESRPDHGISEEIREFRRINGTRDQWRAEDVYFYRMTKHLNATKSELRHDFMTAFDGLKARFLFNEELKGRVPFASRRRFLAFLRLAFFQYCADCNPSKTPGKIPDKWECERMGTEALLTRLLPAGKPDALTAIAQNVIDLFHRYERIMAHPQARRMTVYLGHNWLQEDPEPKKGETTRFSPALAILKEKDWEPDLFLATILAYLADWPDFGADYAANKLWLRLRECALDIRPPTQIADIVKDPNYHPTLAGGESVDHWIPQELWFVSGEQKTAASEKLLHSPANLSLLSSSLNESKRELSPVVIHRIQSKIDENQSAWPSFRLLAAWYKEDNADLSTLSAREDYVRKLNRHWAEVNRRWAERGLGRG